MVSPQDNFPATSNDVTLKWTKNGEDPGDVNSPVTAIVEISIGDTLFTIGPTTIIETDIVEDSLQYTFPGAGDYWWRVLLVDEAGNLSPFYSYHRKLTIP